MIRQYTLTLKSDGGGFVPSDAYRLYAAMLEMADAKAAEELHNEERPALSHCLIPIDRGGGALWRVTLLRAEQHPDIAALLDDCEGFRLKSFDRPIKCIGRQNRVFNDIAEIMKIAGQDENCPRFFLRFVSPAAFRSKGEYLIFPTIRHIIRSAAMTWNGLFADNRVDDEDAMMMIEEKTKITGYELKSSYYSLKDNNIPGFMGSMTINTKLPAPMLQLLRLLLSLGSLSGIGIKTTLGMGGLTLREFPKKAQ